MNENVIIFWKRPDGVYAQETPGKKVASTISEAALLRLAEEHDVFVLEIADGGKKIKVKKAK